jgi:CheY-like chemotaxis protein
LNAPPAVPQPQSGSGSTAVHPTPSTLARRPVVLVVDDSRFVRVSLVRSLSAAYAIQQAESGERAWELLLLDPSIEAVLSDLSMPGVDGFELLRRVRESVLPRLRALPFAVLSGADDPAQRGRAVELGADRFVVKGPGFEALFAWLADRFTHTADPAGPAPSMTPIVHDRMAGSGGPMSIMPSAIPRPGAAPIAAPMHGRVPDPLQRWFASAVGRHAAPCEVPPVLVRLHASGLDDLPARLRRGVRSADALHVDGSDTAWLCVNASAALALRLALRFGLLAAGRQAPAAGARIEVCIQTVDPALPDDALATLQASAPQRPDFAGLSLRCGAGRWGSAWECQLPWAAARLLIA